MYINKQTKNRYETSCYYIYCRKVRKKNQKIEKQKPKKKQRQRSHHCNEVSSKLICSSVRYTEERRRKCEVKSNI